MLVGIQSCSESAVALIQFRRSGERTQKRALHRRSRLRIRIENCDEKCLRVMKIRGTVPKGRTILTQDGSPG